MRKKRILFVQNIISSNVVTELNGYAAKFKKKGYLVKVIFCSRTEKNRRWQLSEKPIFKFKFLEGFKIELKSKDLFTYFVNPFVFKELNTYNPDTLLIAGWDNFTYQAAFIWGIINHKYIILRSGSTVYEKSWRRTLSKPLVRFFIQHTDEFYAYGTRAKEYLVSLGANPAKVKLVFNDVNGRFFRGQAKKIRPHISKFKRELGITTKTNLLFVGQFIERKGVDLLLKSYSTLKAKNPQLGLILCGYGQLEGELKDYISIHRLSDVYFLGYVEQYDLPKYYCVADCLVMPSREEVWGLVANEALHCGTPAIVSDVSGCSVDLIKSEKNGAVFKSDSVKSLTNLIKKVLRLS